MKYRDLIPGEDTFQSGDIFGSDRTPIPVSLYGETVLVTGFQRPIKDNWISFKDRKPTKEDALSTGKLYWTWMLHGKREFGELDYSATWRLAKDIYWMPLNFVPREPARIKVDGHEVIPGKDGSVKVGCQTVSSPDFEEIVRQRNEALLSSGDSVGTGLAGLLFWRFS